MKGFEGRRHARKSRDATNYVRKFISGVLRSRTEFTGVKESLNSAKIRFVKTPGVKLGYRIIKDISEVCLISWHDRAMSAINSK